MHALTVFLLSPARTAGVRAEMLATSQMFPLARQLQSKEGVELGEVFAWLSALYFRGKLAYARAFSTFPPLVMAPGFGLAPASVRIGVEALRAMGAIDIASEAFLAPLRRDVALIAGREDVARVVILGSVATGKYTDTLLASLGKRLLFPSDFVGRGDMSRGGLLLRAVRNREELTYAPVVGTILHGTRPARLPRRR